MNQNSKAILVSTSTKAAHTFRHGIEHIDYSTISAMHKHVNILFILVRALYYLFVQPYIASASLKSHVLLSDW